MTTVGVDYGLRKLALAALPPERGGRRGPPRLFSCFWDKADISNSIATMGDIISEWNDELDDGLAGTDIAIEFPFMSRNRYTSIRMGMVAGALRVHLSEYTDPHRILMVSPAEWKRQIVGRGNANKDDTMKWLTYNHPAWTYRNDDEADALCMAMWRERNNVTAR